MLSSAVVTQVVELVFRKQNIFLVVSALAVAPAPSCWSEREHRLYRARGAGSIVPVVLGKLLGESARARKL